MAGGHRGRRGVVLFSFLMLLVKRYKRCPSNRVLVIFGKTGGGNAAKCIHGGAAFVWPLIQDYAYLSLEPIQIEIPLKGALSIENIRVNVPSVFTVAIGTDPETMQNAAIRLLGLDTEEIKQQAEDIIFGQLRQVIASMRIEDINRDRDKFLQSIQTSLEPELKKIGLVLINVNITDITDESGYIEAIGRKAASQAIQQAKIDVAEQEKQGEIGVAEAEREKVIQVANATKLREIGTREADARAGGARRRSSTRSRRSASRRPPSSARRRSRKRSGSRRSASPSSTRNRRSASRRPRSSAKRRSRTPSGRCASRWPTPTPRRSPARPGPGDDRGRAGELAGQAGRGVPARRDAASARPRRPCRKPRTARMAKAALAEAERVEAEQRADARSAGQGREGQDRSSRPRPRPRSAASRPKAEAAAIYAKLEAEARGQYEILAKKGEGLKQIIEACGGAQAGVPAADARAPRQAGRDVGARRSRTSSSTRSSSGRTAAATATAVEHAELPARAWPGRCRR